MAEEYNDIEAFAGIDLTDSFIIDWNYNGDDFQIALEFSIWPESQYYQTPKSGDYTCYRMGVIKFLQIRNFKGYILPENIQPNIDPDRSKDYGNVDSLEIENNKYILITDFTKFEFECDKIEVEINDEL